MIRSLLKLLVLVTVMVFPVVGWAQTNITPTRTDVSGFSSWTDASVGGTTYLQLLTSTSNTISPAMNFSGYTGTALNFKARTFGGVSSGPNTITVSISTDNGGTWATLGTRTPASTTLTAMTAFSLTSYTGAQVKIRFQSLSANGTIGFGIDDIDITGTAVTCTTPTTQASGLSLSNIGTAGFDASWTAGTGNGTMIVVRPTAQSAATPVSGTAYTANTSWASAGQIDANNRVVFRTAGAGVTGISGLSTETQYTATAYEYNGGTECYNTSALSTATAYTLSTEPGAHAAGFTATAAAYNQVNLSFSAASTLTNADGYIILQKTGSAPTGLPADAQSYTVGTAIGDATVAAIVNSTSTTSQNITGLSGGNNYYFELIPFNANAGQTAQTFNYLTAATIPVQNATTPAAPSTTSDITDNGTAGFYTANIDYTQWQSASITSIGTGTGSGVGVFSMLLRDGGAPASDADAFPTALTALTVGYTGTANTIRSAALFDGSTKVADGAVSGNSITFSGISGVAAADNSTKALTLAVTFNTAVADNDKLAFTINSATAGSTLTSSQFAAANAGGAASENNTGNDNNRIEVTATKLRFVQQPSNTVINASMTPAVTVDAADANNNRDLDFTSGVSLTSSGTLTGAPVSVTAVAGLATFSSLTHTVAGTSLTLTAAGGSLTNAPSNTFNITSFGGKLWSGGAGTSNWTDATNWSPNGVPAAGDDVWLNNDIVAGSYSVTISGNNNAAGRLKVGYAGNTNTITALITGGSSSNDALILGNLTGDDLIVDDGGVVNNSSAASGSGNRGIEFTSSACTWSMTGTGKYIHNQGAGGFINAGSGNIAEPSLGDNTTFEVQKQALWAAATGVGKVKHYGNLILNFNTAFQTLESSMAGGDTLLVKGNMELKGGGAQVRVLNANSAAIVVDVRGDLTVGDGCALIGSNGVGTGAKIIVGGNTLTNGATTQGYIAGSSGSGNPTSGTNEVILKGDFTGYYNSSRDQEKLTFDGNTTESSVQFTSGSTFLSIDINKPIKLTANIPGSRTINVNSGGTLNFNGFNAAGSGAFNVLSGGALKITSADGITSATGSTTGNVVTTSGTRSFNAGATYHYTGSTAQVPGTGLPATVSNVVINNTAGVTLAQPVTVSSSLTFVNGTLTLGSNDLTVNGSISGAGSSSYVKTTGTGTLKQTVTGSAVAFPVGNTAYNPATLTNSGTSDVFGVRVADAVYNDGIGTSTTAVTSPVVNHTWFMSEGTTGGSNVTMTLQWKNGEEVNGFDYNHVYVAHHNGTSWENYLAAASLTAGTAPAATNIGSGYYSVSQSGISSLSPFTVGSAGMNPLQIHLTAINAIAKNGMNHVSWQIAAADEGDYFELERSNDAVNFSKITTIYTTAVKEYSFDDKKPFSGMNHYRLRMVSRDGRTDYSRTVAVNTQQGGFSCSTYPNPVTDKLTINVSNAQENASVTIMDMQGKILKQLAVQDNLCTVDMSAFGSGIYLVRYTDAAHTELFKIVK